MARLSIECWGHRTGSIHRAGGDPSPGGAGWLGAGLVLAAWLGAGTGLLVPQAPGWMLPCPSTGGSRIGKRCPRDRFFPGCGKGAGHQPHGSASSRVIPNCASNKRWKSISPQDGSAGTQLTAPLTMPRGCGHSQQRAQSHRQCQPPRPQEPATLLESCTAQRLQGIKVGERDGDVQPPGHLPAQGGTQGPLRTAEGLSPSQAQLGVPTEPSQGQWGCLGTGQRSPRVGGHGSPIPFPHRTAVPAPPWHRRVGRCQGGAPWRG